MGVSNEISPLPSPLESQFHREFYIIPHKVTGDWYVVVHRENKHLTGFDLIFPVLSCTLSWIICQINAYSLKLMHALFIRKT